jgi:hypothetical protein
MSLTVCFLTRNEAGTIERAVRSVSPVADQVVVADTGSADGTAQAAARAGATVVSFTWGDDFAAGRNFTLRHASGEWVLWMQANEELLATSHDALRACIAHPDAFGFFVRVRNVTDPSRPDQAAETADLRLFRRPSTGQDLFVGRLHPHFRPEVVSAVAERGQPVLRSDVVLRADVDPGPPAESKLRFNARLLELELHDRPGQLHYLIEYARVLRLLRDDPDTRAKAHATLAEAAAVVAQHRHAPSPPSFKVQVLLNDILTGKDAGAGATAGPLSYDDARDLALRWFPSSPNLLWTVAEQNFKRHDYAGAAEVLQRLLHLGRTGTYDRSHRFDPRVLGEDALLNLGACYLQMGRLDEAEACFVQLATSPLRGRQVNEFLATVQNRRKNAGNPGV